MAWIKLTNAETGRAAYYNTDNIVEIAARDAGKGSGKGVGGTRLAAIAASGSPLSIDTMNYMVAEAVEEVMARVARAGEAVAG